MDSIMQFVRQKAMDKLCGDSTGHDYHHVERVAALGMQLAETEGADPLVCGLCGYLHDYYRPDEKERKVSHTGEEALAAIRAILEESGLDPARVDLCVEIIAEHEYYPHAGQKTPPRALESRILQDADRLDAIGAIGIARCFMYSGAHGSPMYRPEKGRDNLGVGSAIGHFYDKLLHLADEMHTQAAHRVACHHQKVMQSFLDAFYSQWESKIPVE